MIRSLTIKNKRWFNKHTFGLEFYLPGLKPRPGQFFQISIHNTLDPFLNRPISIASYQGNRLVLIIKIVGKGTRLLSEKNIGDTLTLLGPLGKGIRPKRKKSLLLAGGIGVAPLYFLAQYLYENKTAFDFIYGTKTLDDRILKSKLEKISGRAIFMAEHGTGRRGTVLSALKEISLTDYEVAYACGPKAMLIELQSMKIPLPVYAFCEDFLGCGLGLCLGCAIMDRGIYKRICYDGPVFELKGIQFEG